MAIKTYDDITSFEHDVISSPSQVKQAKGFDLRDEAYRYLEGGHKDAVLLWAGAWNAEGICVLYLPAEGRAGVAWGATADWTDAGSAEDALERYFGVDDKEMCD